MWTMWKHVRHYWWQEKLHRYVAHSLLVIEWLVPNICTSMFVFCVDAGGCFQCEDSESCREEQTITSPVVACPGLGSTQHCMVGYVWLSGYHIKLTNIGPIHWCFVPRDQVEYTRQSKQILTASRYCGNATCEMDHICKGKGGSNQEVGQTNIHIFYDLIYILYASVVLSIRLAVRIAQSLSVMRRSLAVSLLTSGPPPWDCGWVDCWEPLWCTVLCDRTIYEHTNSLEFVCFWSP